MDDEDLDNQYHGNHGKEHIEKEFSLQAITFALFDQLEYDEKPVYFQNVEDVNALLNQHFSDGRIPEPIESFDDFENDETISHMAFYGIGQNFLKKAECRGKGKITYEVDTAILSQFETRPGYEMYGATAIFGEDKKLIEIYVCSIKKIVKPEHDEWKHAKWIWRASLLTLATVGPHLTEV